MGQVSFSVKGFSCERCGHRWVPRKQVHPKVCPECKSPYWDTKRKPKICRTKPRPKKVVQKVAKPAPPKPKPAAK